MIDPRVLDALKVIAKYKHTTYSQELRDAALQHAKAERERLRNRLNQNQNQEARPAGAVNEEQAA